MQQSRCQEFSRLVREPKCLICIALETIQFVEERCSSSSLQRIERTKPEFWGSTFDRADRGWRRSIVNQGLRRVGSRSAAYRRANVSEATASSRQASLLGARGDPTGYRLRRAAAPPNASAPRGNAGLPGFCFPSGRRRLDSAALLDDSRWILAVLFLSRSACRHRQRSARPQSSASLVKPDKTQPGDCEPRCPLSRCSINLDRNPRLSPVAGLISRRLRIVPLLSRVGPW